MKKKASCVLWFHETKSAITVQCNSTQKYQRIPPNVKFIKNWFKKFINTGSVEDLPRAGRPKSSGDTVDAVRTAFQRS